MNVAVTGSLSFDFIMDFPGHFADRIMPDKIHSISLSFLADKLNKQFGGCATNFTYTFKLLGGEPYLITAAGNDWLPYKQFLQKHGIDTRGIKVFRNELCSCYFVVTDLDDNQIGSFYVGASRYNSRLSIKPLEKADMVVIGPTDPKAMKKYVEECHQRKLSYLYDPAFQIGNFTPEELSQGLSKATILIGNDYEISLIEKKLGVSHDELRAIVPVVVTTLAHKGSLVEAGEKRFQIKPAKPKKVIDPTGAGDAYRAGFLAGYLRGFNLTVCGQMGSVAAVYTVEKYGTVTHHFTQKNFIQRYKENFGALLKL